MSQEKPDPYFVLGVDKKASKDEIRKARTKKCKEANLDFAVIADINSSYRILDDPFLRSAYDNGVHVIIAGVEEFVGGGWNAVIQAETCREKHYAAQRAADEENGLAETTEDQRNAARLIEERRIHDKIAMEEEYSAAMDRITGRGSNGRSSSENGVRTEKLEKDGDEELAQEQKQEIVPPKQKFNCSLQ